MHERLNIENSGSKKADIIHIIKKYEAPAKSPHKKRRHMARLENRSPATAEATQYISIMHTLTTPSLTDALYNKKATARSKRALTMYAASRHFNSATAFFTIHTSQKLVLFFQYCYNLC
jgi:hypothetical protein